MNPVSVMENREELDIRTDVENNLAPLLENTLELDIRNDVEVNQTPLMESTEELDISIVDGNSNSKHLGNKFYSISHFQQATESLRSPSWIPYESNCTSGLPRLGKNSDVTRRSLSSSHMNGRNTTPACQSSDKVPLGILMKNENKTNDIIEVMEYVQQLVPNTREIPEDEGIRDNTAAGMRPLPLGGDQLTCERIRAAHMAMEDFHEKMNFLQATFDRFLDAASGREGGTLYQLRNLINRRNVSKKTSDNYHANSAFLDLVTDCHVLVATMQHLKMQNLDDRVVSVSPLLALASVEFKKRVLDNIVGGVIDKYLINKLSSGLDRIESGYRENEDTDEDNVFNYASNLTQYGLLRKISVLATRSGDGLRQMRHWKFAMLVYDIGHKIKYRLESFILLAGVNALFTQRQRHQVIWNRFVNLSGGEGNNLDGDYVMELLNKYAKSRIKQLGPNHSPEIVDKIGKTMMFCHDINVRLEKQIGVAAVSRKHQSQDLVSDRNRIICQLKESKVFQFLPGRSHNHFQNESSDLFGDIDPQELNKWIKLKKMEYSGNKFAF